MNKKILSGAFWLSAGNILSRILGILYLIPWIIMIGTTNISSAQALFNSAYTPYALFISLGTAGFPSAIARRVSLYNSNKQYKDSSLLLKSGLILMGGSGFCCAIILFIIAPLIAKNSPVTSYTEAIYAIRTVTPALIIIPIMSALRGWLQGNQDLKPFGISQIIEQFIRVAFILVSTYVILYVFKLNITIAVQASIFAAFLGALCGLLYLNLYLFKHYKLDFSYILTKSELFKTLKLIKVTFYESIPFLLVGSGITLSQLIDQIYFKQIMHNFLGFSLVKIQYIYTLFSANPNKITTVVIALAMAISETSLPLLAAESKNKVKVKLLLSQNITYIFMFLLPIVIILECLAYEINLVFYSKSLLGGFFLQLNLLQALIMAISIDFLTLLQALRYSKKATIYIITGLGLKLLLQFPLVYFFQGQGAILATDFAFCYICLISYRKLSLTFGIKICSQYLIIFINIGYSILCFLFCNLCSKIFLPSTKISAFLYVAVISLLLLIIYLVLLDLFDVTYRQLGRYLIFKKYLPRHSK